jgi:hypothetical protein
VGGSSPQVILHLNPKDTPDTPKIELKQVLDETSCRRGRPKDRGDKLKLTRVHHPWEMQSIRYADIASGSFTPMSFGIRDGDGIGNGFLRGWRRRDAKRWVDN